jgi:hypothetical protein
MTHITIVYKTYRNDLKWLRYSLLSIKKYITFDYQILIYCHDECYGDLTAILNELQIVAKTIPVMYDIHGYIKQMIVKLECYKDITTKYALLIDSDCIFKENVVLEDILIDNKIYWYYSVKNEANSHGPEWTVWKKAYEDQSKEIQDKHYMSNGHPFIFTKDALERASNKFKEMHGQDYLEYCRQRLNTLKIKITDPIRPNFTKLSTVFEEFEWYGFYCHKFQEPDYIFGATPKDVRKLIQYWSHGGIEHREKEIQSFL